MFKYLNLSHTPTTASRAGHLGQGQRLGDSREGSGLRVQGRPRVPTLAATGDRYVVADCGGGTVDLTVHQLEQPHGTLKELYKASGE